jgi:hypothetical protein
MPASAMNWDGESNWIPTARSQSVIIPTSIVPALLVHLGQQAGGIISDVGVRTGLEGVVVVLTQATTWTRYSQVITTNQAVRQDWYSLDDILGRMSKRLSGPTSRFCGVGALFDHVGDTTAPASHRILLVLSGDLVVTCKYGEQISRVSQFN